VGYVEDLRGKKQGRGRPRWRARWRDPAGRERSKSFARKVDAERFLVDVQHRLLSGTYVDSGASRTTLDAFADVYLARQPWRASTAEKATQALAHPRRVLGSRPMGSLRKGDVQAFVHGLELAPSTAATTFQHLNSLLEAAAEDGLIARNPAKGVKLPPRAVGEVLPPTVEQVGALYENAPSWFRPAIVLGAGLGLHQAEVSGLTVDRVLWLERSVRIDRQWGDPPRAGRVRATEGHQLPPDHPRVAVGARRARRPRRPSPRRIRAAPGLPAGQLQ
jgi:hypothetical protein